MARRVRDERGGGCEVGGGGDRRRGASTAAEIQPKINQVGLFQPLTADT